jgi:putative glutamine amidotransferase
VRRVTGARGPLLGLTMGRDRKAEPHYRRALKRAGAVVRTIAAASGSPADVNLSAMDGLVFSGGGDIHPRYYGTPLLSTSAGVDTARDDFELELAPRAVDLGLPLLGICRGIQLLNVALGGTLYQDIQSELPGQGWRHKYQTTDGNRFHRVTLLDGSWVRQWGGEPAVMVNSHHHQAVQVPARGLRVTAWAPDGIIEAVEALPSLGLIIGLQWHPERFSWDGQWPLRAFVEACAGGRAGGA